MPDPVTGLPRLQFPAHKKLRAVLVSLATLSFLGLLLLAIIASIFMFRQYVRQHS